MSKPKTKKTQAKPKLYELTDEHRAKLKPWADRWIANALSTEAMSEAERDSARVAVNGLYDAAKIERPENIVFCASPITGSLAAGIAAGVWYLREHPEQHVQLFGRRLSESELIAAIAPACRIGVAAAKRRLASLEEAPVAPPTRAATRAATYAATSAATDDATRAATRAATYAATDAATRAATSAATDAATSAATSAATRAATYAATSAATYAATDARSDVVRFLLGCCYGAYYRMWNGGNAWSAWASYLSFFRHIAKLDIDYSKWEHYEALAIVAGSRYMHQKFCIVCDRPEVLRLDARNLPHAENGPSHRWRDGWELYFWHGVRIPEAWIRDKASLAPATALNWRNAEQRRAAAEIIGWSRILGELDAKVVHEDPDPEIGTLLRADLPDSPGEQFLKVRCGTGRDFVLPVPPTVRTAIEAQEWMWNLNPREYVPEFRT